LLSRRSLCKGLFFLPALLLIPSLVGKKYTRDSLEISVREARRQYVKVSGRMPSRIEVSETMADTFNMDRTKGLIRENIGKAFYTFERVPMNINRNLSWDKFRLY